MTAALKVTRVRRTIYGARITVKARRDTESRFGSFLGDRTFWLNKGDRLTLRVKGRSWDEGDRLSMSALVSSAWDWASIPWEWA